MIFNFVDCFFMLDLVTAPSENELVFENMVEFQPAPDYIFEGLDLRACTQEKVLSHILHGLKNVSKSSLKE